MFRKLANLLETVRITVSARYAQHVSTGYWNRQTVSLEELTDEQRHMFFDNLAQILDPGLGEKILDYGCGAGEKASYLANRGYSVVGADISESLLAEARSLGVDCSTIDVLKASGQTFDHVYLHGVFMYVHPRERENFLNQLRPLVKQGGRLLLLGEPDIEKRWSGPRNRVQIWLAPVLPVYQFFNASFWTKPDQLDRQARSAGYDRCEQRDGPSTITAPDRSHFILTPG